MIVLAWLLVIMAGAHDKPVIAVLASVGAAGLALARSYKIKSRRVSTA